MFCFPSIASMWFSVDLIAQLLTDHVGKTDKLTHNGNKANPFEFIRMLNDAMCRQFDIEYLILVAYLSLFILKN